MSGFRISDAFDLLSHGNCYCCIPLQEPGEENAWPECSYLLEVLYHYSGKEWSFLTLLEAWTVFKEVLREPVVTQLNTKIRVAIHIFLCRYGIRTSCNFIWSVINKYLASYINNQQVDNNHSCKHKRSAKNMTCLCNSVISRNCIAGNIEGNP